MPAYSLDRVMDRLLKYVETFDTRSEAAKAMGISPQYLSDMILRRRRPSPSVLRALRMRRVDRYEDA
jgi:helix-turn-helix protein